LAGAYGVDEGGRLFFRLNVEFINKTTMERIKMEERFLAAAVGSQELQQLAVG
jgi:hypothetical protein